MQGRPRFNFWLSGSARGALLCVCGANAAWGAPPPDAGQLLQQTAPAPALPNSDPKVTPRPQMQAPAQSSDAVYRAQVTSFRITGNAAFSAAVLEGLLSDGRGKPLTLADMNTYADRITQYYRNHGFLVARAYIPQQDIAGGVLQIAVLEGRLAAVNLDNRSRTAARAIQPYLSVLGTGAPVQAPALEQQLLLISDLPGVLVTSVIKPGREVGDSELDVQTSDGPRVVGDVDADNYGIRATGEFRVGGTLNVNGPLEFGDLLSLDAETSGSRFKYAHGEYSLPVGGYGTRVGLSGAHLSYALGDIYEDLQAHGTANVGGVFVNQSLWRGYQYNIRASGGFDVDKLHDVIGSVGLTTDKTVREFTLGLSGDGHDRFAGGGANAWSAKVITGKLDIDGDAAVLDAGPTGNQAGGDFTKFNGYAIRLQALPHQFSAYVALSGQAASKNLDSSQKFSLGGPYAVRAYQQGEGSADEAWLATAELRYDLAPVPGLQLVSFFDAGEAVQERHPQAVVTGNTEHLSGAGVAATWALAGRFRVGTFAAWRTGDAPVTDRDRSPRVGAQAVFSF
jgi:hemolysin activation/secretion protein